MAAYLVTGATGQLGSHIVAELSLNPHNRVVALYGHQTSLDFPKVASTLRFACPVHYVRVDFGDDPKLWTDIIVKLLEEHQISHVIHCAAISSVMTAFQKPDLARAVNVEATRALAVASSNCTSFVFCSTDMVFDGEKAPVEMSVNPNAEPQVGSFYEETDCTCPLSTYGRTKVEAEEEVSNLAACHKGKVKFLIVRCPLMFGTVHLPHSIDNNKTTFVQQLRQLSSSTTPCYGFIDEFRTPMSFRNCGRQIVALCNCVRSTDPPCEILHLAGQQRVSRYELLQVMKTVLCNVLLGNDIELEMERPDVLVNPLFNGCIVRALGREDLLSNQHAKSSPPRSPSREDSVLSEELLSPVSPRSVLCRLGDMVCEKVITPSERNSNPGSELRPADLSMNAKLAANRFAERSVQVPFFSLEKDIERAILRWFRVLSAK